MTDNGGNDRRRDIEGRINTLGAGNDGVGSRRSDREDRRSGDASPDTDADDSVSASLTDEDDEEDTAVDVGSDTDVNAENGADPDGDEAAESESDNDEDTDADTEDAPFETRESDIDERNALEIEMDRFVRAFAARRAETVGEESLDEYIVGSVKGYLAGLLGGDVESPGTLKRRVEVEADDIFGGLLDAVADDEQDRGDVVVEAVAEMSDVPEDDKLLVAGLRDHEALLNGVVANNANSLSDVSAVVQAAVETRLIEEPAE